MFLLGIPGVPLSDVTVNGVYGPHTANAVRKLQEHIGFTGNDVDGNFGPGTRAKLYEEVGVDVSVILASAFTGKTTWVNGECVTVEEPWPPE